MDDKAIWECFVGQVNVIGNTKGANELSEAMKRIKDLLSYTQLCRMDDKNKDILTYINSILRKYKIRYAGKIPSKCAKSKAIMKNLCILRNIGGPKKYLQAINNFKTDSDKINAIFGDDLSYIKSKGVRDILTNFGIVTNTLGLDSRIQNVFGIIGIKLSDNFLNNRSEYEKLEKEIIEQICIHLHIKGAILDRILYQNYESILLMLKEKAE